MRNVLMSLSANVLVIVAVVMPAGADISESCDLEETFTLAAGGRLVVDNVFGSIRVTGVAGDTVR